MEVPVPPVGVVLTNMPFWTVQVLSPVSMTLCAPLASASATSNTQSIPAVVAGENAPEKLLPAEQRPPQAQRTGHSGMSQATELVLEAGQAQVPAGGS